MASFSNMYSNLGINIQNFSRGLKQATSQLNSFATNARDKVNRAAGGFNTASENVKAFGRNLKGQTSSAMQAMEDLNKSTEAYGFTVKSVSRIVSGIVISQAFYNAVQNIRNATNAVWEFSKQLEYAKIAYSNLFGDTSLALEFINVLKDFAAKTPFTFTDAEAAAKRLLAYGIEYKNIMYVMQGVLSAAAMQGDPTKIESISRALGQIYTYGKLMTAEVRQLSEAGIPAYEILQEELGLTQEQLRNLGNEGIAASDAINALVDGMQKRFGNVVQASAMTITGIISNIKDNATMLFAGLFEPLTVVIKSALAALGSFLFTLRDIEETAGAGGVFEHLFPPELHSTLRLFVANLKVALQSVIMFAVTLGNVLKPVLLAIVNIYNAFAPIIHSVSNALLAATYYITSNAQAMKVLTAMLAVAGAMWVAFKVRALGSVVVAGAIHVISKALAGLATMLTFVMAHPFWALLIGLTGVVVGLSTGFGNLAEKVKGFVSNLTKVNGVDADSILMPSQKKRANDLEKFNNALDGTADSMEDLADKTDKANKNAKNAKKTMEGLLSFDEVFKLNEPDETSNPSNNSPGIDTSGLEDMMDGLGGLGSGFMPTVPDFSTYMQNLKDAFLNPFRALWQTIQDNIATIASTAIGAGLGAAIGFIIGGPLGAKIGAVLGGLAGFLWGRLADALNIQPRQHIATLFSGGLMAAIKAGFSLFKNLAKGLVPTYIDDAFVGFSKMANFSWIKTLTGSIKKGLLGAITGLGVGILANALTGWIAKEFDLAASDLKNAGTGQMIGNIIGTIVGLIFGGPVGSIAGGAIGQLAGSIVGVFWDSLSTLLQDSIIGGVAGVPIGAILGPLIGGVAGPVGAAIGAVIGVAIGALVGTIYENWGEITGWFKKIKNESKTFIDNTSKSLINGWQSITKPIREVLSGIFSAVKTVWNDITGAISKFLSDIFNAVKTVWTDIKNAIGTFLSDIFNAIKTIWNDIHGAISKVLSDIHSIVSSVFSLIRDVIVKIVTEIWKKVDEKFGHIFDAISTKVHNAYTYVSTWFKNIYDAIVEKVNQAYSYVSTWFSNIYNSIKSSIYDAYTYVSTWFSSIYTVIKSKVYDAYTYVKEWFASIYSTVKTNVKNAYDSVSAFFGNMYNSVKTKITEMYNAVKNGTKDMYTTFKNWVQDLYDNTFGKLFKWLDTGIEKIREFLKLDEKASKNTPTNNYTRSYTPDTGHATGGIFNREHVARFAEGNKAEAVIPLENASAMQPFVDAISRGLIEGLAPTLVQTRSSNTSNDLPPMYVGTLIADEQGLKQLYRRFELIKAQEDVRKGFA